MRQSLDVSEGGKGWHDFHGMATACTMQVPKERHRIHVMLLLDLIGLKQKCTSLVVGESGQDRRLCRAGMWLDDVKIE